MIHYYHIFNMNSKIGNIVVEDIEVNKQDYSLSEKPLQKQMKCLRKSWKQFAKHD